MKRKGISYAKYGYIFCIPFVVIFLIFSLYPLIFTTVLGFTKFRGITASEIVFLDNPFDNFKSVLNNGLFIRSLKNTVTMWIWNFIPQIVLALLLTAWFTNHRRKIRGQGVFKVLFYLPNIITAASVAILFGALFAYPTGPVNDLVKRVGFSDTSIEFLRNKATARGIVSFIQFWTWYGYTMIVLISGVLGINPELFEASEIDGASGRQTFFFVTIPNLRTILIYTMITSLIGGLQMFDIPRLFLDGGPDNSTLTTNLFIHNIGFKNRYQYDTAAAASMIMFLIIAFLSIIVFYIMRDKHEVKQRKELKEHKKMMKRAYKEGRGN